MKTKQILAALLVAAALFSACSKDAADGMAGTWEGKWGGGSETPQYFLKFTLTDNGQLQRLDEENHVIATGTWTLDGIEFECSYTHSDGQTHRIGGLYTDFDGTIIGTWGYHPSKANGGEIELKKQ